MCVLIIFLFLTQKQQLHKQWLRHLKPPSDSDCPQFPEFTVNSWHKDELVIRTVCDVSDTKAYCTMWKKKWKKLCSNMSCPTPALHSGLQQRTNTSLDPAAKTIYFVTLKLSVAAGNFPLWCWNHLRAHTRAAHGCKSKKKSQVNAGHLAEDGVWLLNLHHIQDVKWDIAGLAAAIP